MFIKVCLYNLRYKPRYISKKALRSGCAKDRIGEVWQGSVLQNFV
jgi:hypothetical protein